ncbi:MAG: hypothetical protein JO219_06350 [Candidatus Eremiobacteraeota bacterium]|nr:hypothetical protein [Candidatus Eremiobacteraeota bacterium]MBV8365820.1 hypothetical protein [Candidatus Eremiobacteraeota bacterium]
MRTSISRRTAALALILAASTIALCGCSSLLKERLVDLRNAQADAALQDDKIVEAEKEYGLALALAPNDEHARAGFAHAAYLHAKSAVDAGDIDTAQIEIQKSLKYAPKDAAALDLSVVIDQARIRRDVVVANFPAYRASSDVIRDLLKANEVANKNIQQQIHLFNADYDVSHLRKATALSTDLEAEDHRVTQRLIALRGEIEAVAPGESRPAPAEEVPGLLPIP